MQGIAPLGIWLLASGAAVLVAPFNSLAAIGVALVGGATFGWWGARQLDPRRVRRRRSTGTSSQPPEGQPS